MWNSCENWKINQPPLLYEHPVASNQVVVANANANVMLFYSSLTLHLFSLIQNLARGILCRGQDHWAGGGRECNYSGLRVYWEGGPKLSPRARWRCLWECSSELYMNMSSIERLYVNAWSNHMSENPGQRGSRRGTSNAYPPPISNFPLVKLFQ